MAFGNEIRFKIGGDTSSLEKSFASLPAKAEAAGRKASAAFARTQQAADKIALAIDKERESRRYGEASTLERIKRTTIQLRDLTQERDTYQRRSVPWLQKQLEIEEKTTRLRQLQRQAQASRAAEVVLPPSDSDVGTNAGGRRGLLGRFQTSLGRFVVGAAVGAVTGIIEILRNQIESGIRFAQAQESSRAEGVESLRSRFATIGGLGGQYRQGVASEKDLEVQRKFAEARVAQLGHGVQGVLSAIRPEEMERAKAQVEEINAKLQKQHDQNALIFREIQRQNIAYKYQQQLVTDIQYVQESGGSGLLAAKVKASSLVAQFREMQKRKDLFTPEEVRSAALSAQAALGDFRLGMRAMQAKSYDTLQSLTADAAGGRTFANGRPRPLSETERLARRAEAYRQRERDAVLTGSSSLAADMQSLAMRNEKTVAARLQSGSSKIKNTAAGDLTQVAAKIENSNTLLTAIKDSLAIVYE